jgi:glycosyltransferase involved in cell wall biosynthesis
MQKILFFETHEFTGATRVTRTLAKAAAKKYEVAFAYVGNNVKEDIESAIARERPDILFSSFVEINPVVIQIGKQNNLYVIVRNDYNLKDVSKEQKKRIIETYPFADEVIVQTEEMKYKLLQNVCVDASKIKIMDNPLDEEEILQKAAEPNPFPDNGCFHFLWVGRKAPIKDLPTLQKAFEIVNKLYSQTDLTLVSNDSNPYRWMKNSDCLVISSLSEASPNVLREALFLGTPVISTDCSETVRKLLPSQNIVPTHNPEALAKAMAELVKDKVKGKHR